MAISAVKEELAVESPRKHESTTNLDKDKESRALIKSTPSRIVLSKKQFTATDLGSKLNSPKHINELG